MHNNVIMEHHKIVNLLQYTPTQPSKIGQKFTWHMLWPAWNYNTNSQIKLNTSMLKPCLCEYSDTYILAKRNITVIGVGATTALRRTDTNDKQLTEINNKQLDIAKDLDVVIVVHDWAEHSDNYSKTSGSLYQFCWVEPPLKITAITEFKSFNSNQKY